MKNNSLLFAILTIALSSSISLHAQNLSNHHVALHSPARVAMNGDGPITSRPQSGNFAEDGAPILPLSAYVIPGADTVPVWGLLDQPQSDGRALHNIQVDPSNPMNIHAVIMEETGTTLSDETNLYNRRMLYTFSSDGGQSWTKPDTLGTTRDGFACMILYQRGESYVPIIAAHRYLSNAPNSLIESAIWIEQGSPGTGDFTMTECGTQDTNGTEDLLWPYIAINPAADTIYIVAAYDSPTDAVGVGYLEFATFSLDPTGKATFNGWHQEIGANNNNDGNAGYGEEGDYVIRVSPSGKVGLLWREADYGTPNVSLYFIEDTGVGHTFPSTFNPLEMDNDEGVSDGGNEVYTGPSGGLDFFYSGENAKVLWASDSQVFVNDTNELFPEFTCLHLYDVATGKDLEFVGNVPGDTAEYSLAGTLASFDNAVDEETDPYIAYPTIAQSTDANTFAVFYQTFPIADTVFVSATKVKLYGSIYYQVTNDGGTTWTQPTPFETNSGPPNTFGKTDFRWPQVSDWNPVGSGGASATVMFAADTSAGTNDYTSVLDSISPVYFYNRQLNFSGVKASAAQSQAIEMASYPNPFTALTTINFTLPSESNVLLTVTDVLGRSVATLVNGPLGAGQHSAVFSPQNLADGIYRYTLQANGVSISGSMSLVR